MNDNTCIWSLADRDYNIWSCSACNTDFIFNQGSPAGNGFSYCPFCGRKIVTTVAD